MKSTHDVGGGEAQSRVHRKQVGMMLQKFNSSPNLDSDGRGNKSIAISKMSDSAYGESNSDLG